MGRVSSVSEYGLELQSAARLGQLETRNGFNLKKVSA